MPYEVEMKFAIADVTKLLEKLERFGVVFGEAFEECDTFYQHPARDFAITDECLRIRMHHDDYHITYKGPKLDTETKTRREIELFLTSEPQTALQWDELLKAIGFQPVSEVKKTRRLASLVFQEQKFELMLDDLPLLGTFLEIETMSDKNTLDDALQSIKKLGTSFRLKNPINKSYLELYQQLKQR